MKKNLTFIVAFGLVAMSYTTASFFKDPLAPISYTGAPKFTSPYTVRYCTSCHNDFPINTAGGSVVATGLPSGTYNAGQVYNFSITISGPGSVWGFAIKAVNTVNNANVGVFTTTNGNTIVQGALAPTNTQELGHNVAVISATASYTYTNLKWTAPAVPGVNDGTIRFYIVGIAGDESLDETGDYTYSSTVNASLSVTPVTLSSFRVNAANDNAVNINWQTAQEINTAFFEIQASINSSDWQKLAVINARGNSVVTQSYSYTDKKPIAYDCEIYYRLKITDRDGSFRYSAIEVIKLKNSGIVIDQLSAQPLQVYKNGYFKVHSSSDKAINISVIDMNGRVLYTQSTLLRTGTNTIEIPGDKMARTPGMVFINFAADGFLKTFKQIIN